MSSVDKHILARVTEAIARYDPGGCYDETFVQVHERMEAAGEASKFDISALIFWKRIQRARWWQTLLELPDRDVRRTTRRAFALDLTRNKRLDHLSVLPGFGRKDSVPSALLAAWNPEDYAVVDSRARKGLQGLGLNEEGRDLPYLAYLDRVIRIRDDLRAEGTAVSARDIDKALWVLGGESED